MADEKSPTSPPRNPEDKAISIPPDALSDPDAREMLRAWVAHEGLHCTLNIGQWGEREASGWGVLLSDVARHVAQAMHKATGAEPSEILEEIRNVFNEELDEPTSDTSGGFIQIQ
jgi:hypothetical protein